MAETIGQDGLHLLALVQQADAPPELAHLEAIRTLEVIWQDEYEQEDPDDPSPRFRGKGHLVATTQRVVSPHDLDARYARKAQTEWRGYKVHLTETCEPDAPHLIVNVHTTDAGVQDVEVVGSIHQQLQARALLPEEHLMDGMYVGADQIADLKRKYGVTLIGPVRPDVSWQAQDPQAYDLTHFHIHWAAQQVTCPQGKTSHLWHNAMSDYGRPYYSVSFRKADCSPCPVRQRCTRSKTEARTLALLHQAPFEALKVARDYQKTEAFQQQYAKRAGIEGTMHQAMNAFAMRRTRYIGLDKTRLQHLATSVAINLQRIWAWLNGVPHAKTKISAFAALAP